MLTLVFTQMNTMGFVKTLIMTSSFQTNPRRL